MSLVADGVAVHRELPSFMAIAVMVLIPIVVFFISVQKYIVQNLTSGRTRAEAATCGNGKPRRP